MNRKKVLDKINKCLELSKSSNANEAKVARRQADMLKSKYSTYLEDLVTDPEGTWSLDDYDIAYRETRNFYLPYLNRYKNIQSNKDTLLVIDSVLGSIHDIVHFKKKGMYSFKNILTLRTWQISTEVEELYRLASDCVSIKGELDRLYYLYFVPAQTQAINELMVGINAINAFADAYKEKKSKPKRIAHNYVEQYLQEELNLVRKVQLGTLLERLEEQDTALKKCLDQAEQLKELVQAYID